MTRTAILPEILIWARERAGRSIEDLENRFPRLALWESGQAQPTIKQLQSFANAVHVPVGYLFLPKLPQEQLPIPDFRTIDGRSVHGPVRTYWTRPTAARNARDGSWTMPDPFACLSFHSWERHAQRQTGCRGERNGGGARLRSRCPRGLPHVEKALRHFIAQADSIGLLVMVSGVVLSNNNRRLDPDEFRGFALVDRQAPLVFINGADSKSAQMFTLAHELAHLWLGSTAVSNASAAPVGGFRREEVWCNAVAAELLVPLAAIKGDLVADEPVDEAVARLIRRFKVSSLVILRRLLDAGWLTRPQFDAAWAA